MHISPKKLVMLLDMSWRLNSTMTLPSMRFCMCTRGAPNDDGIPLSGRISGKNLTIQGNWVEHLVEYPSKKEIVQTHFVKIGGTLDSASFKGKVEIEGNAPPGESRLKRFEQIWVCRTPDRKKP
jgi:hypothetical protein